MFSDTSDISWRRKFRLSIDIRRLRSSAILSNKVSAESNLYVLSQLKRWNFIDLPRLAIFQQFLLSGSFQCMRLRSLASKLRLQTDSFLFISTKFICLSRNCHAIISLFIRHFRFFFYRISRHWVCTPHLKNQVRLRNDSKLTGTSVPEWNIAILISWIVSEQICWRYFMLLLVFHFCEDMLLRRNRRLFLFGFPRKLWVRAEIFNPHLRMFRAIFSYTNYNDIQLL